MDGCEQQSLGKEPAHVTFVGEQGVPQSLKVVGEKERAAAEDEVRMLPNLSISDKDTITVSGRRKEVYLVPVITDTRPAVPSLVSIDEHTHTHSCFVCVCVCVWVG